MIGYQPSINAARTPGAVALSFGGRRVSYAELNESACRLANGLAASGIGRGERVAALLHNCPEFFVALFAAAKIGAVFVPINFRLTAREIGLILDASAPKALMIGQGFAEVSATLAGSPSWPARVIEVDDRPSSRADAAGGDVFARWLSAQDPSEPDLFIGDDEVLMLMHTSGTTGLPKGAVYTHDTALASSMAKIIDFDLARDDAAVVFGPLFHAGPLMDLALPLLLRGGRVVLGASRNFDPSTLLETIARERGTVVPIYPTMLRRVLALPGSEPFDLATLRLIITGGEAAPLAVIRGVHERFPNAAFINNYGSTEGGPITTFLAAGDSLRRIGSVGKPSFSVDVRIAGDDGRPLPPMQVGEVLVRSPFVCRGYWQRPEATAEALRGGWWHTGDLAYRDEEGFIWIAGRRKDMIKSGGENIYPPEIEQVIAGLDGVAEVAVIGVPDEDWGEAVAAYIVRTPGAQLDAAAVIAHCRAGLAGFKKPRHVRFVEALPRNTTNKVDKVRLRTLFAEGA